MNYRSLCSFYKGEKECPFEAKNGNAGKFWMAEWFVCEEYARNVKIGRTINKCENISK